MADLRLQEPSLRRTIFAAIGCLALLTGSAAAQGAEDTSKYVRESCARSREIAAAVRSASVTSESSRLQHGSRKMQAGPARCGRRR
jgi:hypothetical protein